MIIATFNGFYAEINKTNEKSYGFPLYSYYVITPNNDGYDYVRAEFSNLIKPSLAAVKSDAMLVLEILQWASLPYLDNDHSLFDNHTPEQLKFAQSSFASENSYVLTLAQEGESYTEYANANSELITFEDTDEKMFIIKSGKKNDMLNVAK